jgi:hypothetical protein
MSVMSDRNKIVTPRSGLMGFGWQALASIPGFPWWQGLMSRGKLQEPLFGVYIARQAYGCYRCIQALTKPFHVQTSIGDQGRRIGSWRLARSRVYAYCLILRISLLTGLSGACRFTNTAYYTGDIVYSNLTAPRKTFWQVPVQSTWFFPSLRSTPRS